MIRTWLVLLFILLGFAVFGPPENKQLILRLLHTIYTILTKDTHTEDTQQDYRHTPLSDEEGTGEDEEQNDAATSTQQKDGRVHAFSHHRRRH